MAYCEFVITNGIAYCKNCFFRFRTVQTDPSKIICNCRNPPAGTPKSIPEIRTQPSPLPTATTLPCIHRGEELRMQQCELCGGKSRKVPIHTCAVHGECSVTRYSWKQTMKLCTKCPERSAGDPEQT